MKIMFLLLIQFFKVGMFAIGGGLATIPFLYELGKTYNWFDVNDLAQMLAISNIVPGPVGTNLAAIIGFKAYGFWGSLMAVLGIMIPSLIFVIIISKILKEFESNKYVRSIFYILKPTSCAMIVAIGAKLLFNILIKQSIITQISSIDWAAAGLFLFLVALSLKNKNHSPLFYLGISAIVGILFHLLNIKFIY